MHEHFGLDFDPSWLPDGEFLSLDTLTLTTHTGTHVDAPSHYGSQASYGTPRHIDAMPLEWFLGPGILLDISDSPVGAVGAERISQALEAVGTTPSPGDILLLNTGAAARRAASGTSPTSSASTLPPSTCCLTSASG